MAKNKDTKDDDFEINRNVPRKRPDNAPGGVQRFGKDETDFDATPTPPRRFDDKA